VHVHADLWLDQPDAHDLIEARRASDALTADEAPLRESVGAV
jgi:hypothetical protein